MAVILFSPVGGTDPISNSNYRDGSMLHIVRHFRPDIIHLYLTKEMLDHQKEDNRYLYCLEKLFELQHRENVDIREFQRPDLTEVHDFNFFYQEFRQLLEKRGIPATVRRELGADIDAACGQLRLNAARKRG